VAADRGHSIRTDTRAAKQRRHRPGELLGQIHIDLAEFVERNAGGGVENSGNSALERGIEGRSAGGDDPQRRGIEIDQGGIDSVHAGSGHQAEIKAHCWEPVWVPGVS